VLDQEDDTGVHGIERLRVGFGPCRTRHDEDGRAREQAGQSARHGRTLVGEAPILGLAS
jgi:hypothetical protein